MQNTADGSCSRGRGCERSTGKAPLRSVRVLRVFFPPPSPRRGFLSSLEEIRPLQVFFFFLKLLFKMMPVASAGRQTQLHQGSPTTLQFGIY